MVRSNRPRCKAWKRYKIRRNYWRCAKCHYEYRNARLLLRLTRSDWERILSAFLLEHASKLIAQQTGFERKQILRALTLTRVAMQRDVPTIFSGTVAVDETYLGGQWKNKRKLIRDTGTKRGRGTTKQPVFGILCRKGIVWTEIVPDVEAATLQPLIKNRVKHSSIVCSDTYTACTGIASKGYVHRLVDHSKGQYTKGRAHINGLEGFWGYLKRKLAAKGGIRRERLPLYLAEYV